MITYSIIQKSQLEGTKRLDADYYQPEYLDLEKKLDSVETKTIDEISKSVVSFGAYSLTSYIEWQESGVPYVNVGDIHGGYIDTSNIKHISEKVDEILKKSRVNNGQVLLTMAGTIGNAAVAHNLSRNMNANQAIAKITPIDAVSPYYLAAFLNSKYGQLQTQREIVSSVQANIFLGPIKRFRIPFFDKGSMTKVESIYRDFLQTLEHSQSLYSQAEDVLLEELGLKDFKIDEDLYSVVNFSDIHAVHRMDAEYFQPKYEKIISVSRAHGGVELGELATVKKGFEPGADAYEDEGVLFIRVSSISKHELVEKDQKYISKKLYEELKEDYEPKKGEILLTKDASPGVAHVVDKTVEGIISSGVLRLKLKSKDAINLDYLALCINSVVGQMQVERDAGGSVIAHWKPEQVKSLLVPILKKTTQEKIAKLVQESHVARKKAKELLEEAKRKVEELIESTAK